VHVLLRWVYRHRCLPEPGKSLQVPTPEERRRMVSYGLLNNFNDAGTLFLDSRTDNFFIAAFTDAVSVGIYAFYTRLNEMTANMMPTRLFETVVQPMFFIVQRVEAGRRIPQYFTLLLNLNLALQWPVLAFAVAYHAEIVQAVFGGKFLEHSWLLPLVVAFAAANIIATPVTLVAQYEERAGILLLSKVFGFANIIGMLVLIPLAGIYGAAIAGGSSALVKNLFVWWKVRDLAVWLNAGTALALGVALWGGVVGIALSLKAALHVPALVQLLFGLVLCGVAELAHLRSGAIWRNDRELLMKLFHGRDSRLLRWAGLVPAA
jgi:O-antigen/teichoic acid export membrane protein